MKIRHLIALAAICLLGTGSVMADGYNGIKALKQVKKNLSDWNQIDFDAIYVAEFGEGVYCTNGDGNVKPKSLSEWSKDHRYCFMKFTPEEENEGYFIQLVDINGAPAGNSYLGYNDEGDLCLKSERDIEELKESSDHYVFVWNISFNDRTPGNPSENDGKYCFEDMNGDVLGYATLHTQHSLYNPSAAYGLVGWNDTNDTENVTDVKYTDENENEVSCFKFQHNGKMSQTLNNMPAGKYRITYSARAVGYPNDHSAYQEENRPKPRVKVNDEWTGIFEIEDCVNPRWVEFTSGDFVVREKGDIVIGIEAEDNDEDEDSYILIKDIKIEYQLYQNRSTAEGRYGTICLPYDFSTLGATLYTIDNVEAGTGLITLKTVETEGKAEAGKPYLYQAVSGSQSFEEVEDDNITVYPGENGYLYGSFQTEEEGLLQVAHGDYVLQTYNNEQAFYRVNSNDIYCGTYKAYMKWNGGTAGARAFLNFSNETTAINAINALMNGTAEIYDLNGCRQNGLKKGINIVNGAKVMVK